MPEEPQPSPAVTGTVHRPGHGSDGLRVGLGREAGTSGVAVLNSSSFPFRTCATIPLRGHGSHWACQHQEGTRQRLGALQETSSHGARLQVEHLSLPPKHPAGHLCQCGWGQYGYGQGQCCVGVTARPWHEEGQPGPGDTQDDALPRNTETYALCQPAGDTVPCDPTSAPSGDLTPHLPKKRPTLREV